MKTLLQWFSRCVLPLCSLCLCGSFSVAADPTYWQDVRPVLRKHCTVCHKASKVADKDVSGGLALDSPEAIRRGERVIVPGKPGESRLLELVTTADAKKRMPLDADPLPAEAVELLRTWIAAGAPDGTKPAEAVSAAASPAARKTRKLPVTFATKAALPKGGPLALT